MSASYGLVKFKKTGNVYYCCYEGTSDTLNPFICTAEECYDPKIDCYCAITHCRNLQKLRKDEPWNIPDDTPDLDEVEIYSDYGGGFSFPGIGSESLRKIDCAYDEFGCVDLDISVDGKYEWVDEFFEELREKHLEKLWKRYQETGTDEDYKTWRDAKDEE